MAHILVVDDSTTQKNALIRMLEKHGHKVIGADNGKDGVELAQYEMPDLIMMDVVMPGLNGFQATRQITQNKYTEHIPVVLVSTKAQETDRKWGERQGAKGYLVKPVPEDTLIEAVDTLLAQAQ